MLRAAMIASAGSLHRSVRIFSSAMARTARRDRRSWEDSVEDALLRLSTTRRRPEHPHHTMMGTPSVAGKLYMNQRTTCLGLLHALLCKGRQRHVAMAAAAMVKTVDYPGFNTKPRACKSSRLLQEHLVRGEAALRDGHRLMLWLSVDTQSNRTPR